jgi:hypothetical protein
MKLSISLVVLIALSLTACSTLEVGLEKTPAPHSPSTNQPTPTAEETKENKPPVDPAPTSVSTPDAASSPQKVIAWPGSVVSAPAGSNHDDYIVFQPKGAGEVGVVGRTPEIEQQLAQLRNNGETIHFWGTLQCPADDYNGCQLKVDKVRAGLTTTELEPDPVEGWVGVIGCAQQMNAAAPESCDATAFMLAGSYPVEFDTWTVEENIQTQLTQLRGTGTAVRLWGTVTTGIPVFNGAQIKVTRLEVVQ